MSDIEEKIEAHRPVGEQICSALGKEIDKLDLPELVQKPQWNQAEFSLHNDPALGVPSLEALWLGERGEKLGSAVLHDDGTFFADYDIVQPHPHKAKWFVEAVTAWGRSGIIKSEARLLPMPE